MLLSVSDAPPASFRRRRCQASVPKGKANLHIFMPSNHTLSKKQLTVTSCIEAQSSIMGRSKLVETPRGLSRSPEGGEGGCAPQSALWAQRSAFPLEKPQKRKKHKKLSCFKRTRESRSCYALPVSLPILVFHASLIGDVGLLPKPA